MDLTLITLAAAAGPFVGILVQLLIAVIVFGAIYYVITLIPFPDPWKTIAMVILGVIFLIWLIQLLLPFIS